MRDILDDNKNFLISIIVPVYNTEIFLQKCIDSILNQSYTNLEIIIVNDGSTDNSGYMCDTYAKKDKRIKVIHKENGGLSSARNVGLDICTGDYIAFVDSDDYIHPQFLEYMLKYCINYKSDITMCDYLSVNTDIDSLPLNSVETHIFMNSNDALHELVFGNKIPLIICCNKLYRNNLFNKLRFPEGKFHEDEFVAHRLLHNANKICSIDQYLYYYRRNDKSITGTAYSEHNFDRIIGRLERADFLKTIGMREEYVDVLKDIKSLIKNAEKYCLESENEKVKSKLNDIVKRYNEYSSDEYLDDEIDIGSDEKKYNCVNFPTHEKILIYGAGIIGRKVYDTINKDYISGWVDNMWFYLRKLNINIKPVTDILNIDFDWICLTQKNYRDRYRIKKQIIEWGIPEFKIGSAIIDKDEIKFVME